MSQQIAFSRDSHPSIPMFTTPHFHNALHIARLGAPCDLESQQLYSKRQANVDVFKREETAIRLCSAPAAHMLSNQFVLVDLGAGLSTKTLCFMQCLLKRYPKRQICYIPVDVNEVILSWRDYLDKECPDISQQVIHIQPALLDMTEAVHSLAKILGQTAFSEWELVISLFGPNSTIVHHVKFVQMFREIGQLLKQKGNGGFVFTYLPTQSNLEERINTEYYDKVDMAANMKCVLLGLNQIVQTDANPDNFEFEKEYLAHRKTEGISGEWSGFALYARAKENIVIHSEKLNMSFTLKAGEKIRLSIDDVKAHYYSDEYISSLALTSGLQVKSLHEEPSGLISAAFLGPMSNSF